MVNNSASGGVEPDVQFTIFAYRARYVPNCKIAHEFKIVVCFYCIILDEPGDFAGTNSSKIIR
jgi:hypothetical protein